MEATIEIRGPAFEMRVLRVAHPTRRDRVGTLRWYPAAAVWLWCSGRWACWYDQDQAWALWHEQTAESARGFDGGL